MRDLIASIAFAGCAVAGCPAYAGDVVLPNTFQAGTPAKASEVNANFTAIENAVDDNDARVTALESGQLDKVDKSGDTMTGKLTVPEIAYSTPKTRRALLAMDDFACMDPANCYAMNDAGQWISSTANQTLTLSARLHMPDGAQLVDVWCSFNDNSTSDASFNVRVRRLRTGVGFLVLTSNISTVGASSSDVQILQASPSGSGNWTPSGLTADNSSKAFIVEVNVPYDGGFTGGPFNGNNLALHGCYYDYSVTEP
jgi:hypothetical protein